MSSTTSTPLDARAHARAMAGARVESMPTVPATDATDLPPGIDSTSVVWAETLGAGGYASRVLRRGSVLRLTDLRGDACVNLLVYNAANPIERLNVADTVKVQWNAYPGEGSLLLSDMGRVLMSIVADTSGRHDTFGGGSSERTNTARYGQGANHSAYPNARDRFLLALAKHGLGRRDVMPNINLFRAVRVEQDGSMTFDPDPSGPGAYLELRAEMDVLVVLANTPHVLDERSEYAVTPVRLLAWKGAPTAAGDPIREATPEGLRAFQNTEDYLA